MPEVRFVERGPSIGRAWPWALAALAALRSRPAWSGPGPSRSTIRTSRSDTAGTSPRGSARRSTRRARAPRATRRSCGCSCSWCLTRLGLDAVACRQGTRSRRDVHDARRRRTMGLGRGLASGPRTPGRRSRRGLGGRRGRDVLRRDPRDRRARRFGHGDRALHVAPDGDVRGLRRPSAQGRARGRPRDPPGAADRSDPARGKPRGAARGRDRRGAAAARRRGSRSPSGPPRDGPCPSGRTSCGGAATTASRFRCRST